MKKGDRVKIKSGRTLVAGNIVFNAGESGIIMERQEVLRKCHLMIKVENKGYFWADINDIDKVEDEEEIIEAFLLGHPCQPRRFGAYEGI